MRPSLRRTLLWLGNQTYKLITRTGGNLYEPVQPIASYSPWNADAAFRETFEAVNDHSLVDVYRCYELWTLVEQTAKCASGALLEVGVWRGGTGALIAKRAQLCGIPDPVYLCDTFAGMIKSSDSDSWYEGGEYADCSAEQVEALLRKVGAENARLVEGVFPDETAGQVDAESLRFCHVDVDVYESARDVTSWVWQRLVPGGIVVYDDYGFASCDGIRKLVEEERGREDRVVVHNLNGHAVVIKLHA